VAIAFFAYFIAHTLHRTAAATDPNQEIKTSLHLQQQEIDSLKQELEKNRAQEEEKRKKRLAIRNQLGVFLDEGKRIQGDIEYSDVAAIQEKTAWERRVEDYLAKELDSSYAARFRNPVRVPVTYPEAMSMKVAVPWTDVTERIGMLSTFISELRD
jgi:NAD-specific glutamate dehydrogenase